MKKTVKKKKFELDELTTWISICKAKGIHPVKSLPFPVPTNVIPKKV